MTRFSKQWDAMSIEERIDHLLADWRSCRETNDPVVLRVAATMAHHVLGQAREAMEQLRLSCEERGANWASHEHEMRDQITALRAERDEARREICSLESQLYHEHGNTDPAYFGPMAQAAVRGWDCFKEEP